MKIGFCLHGDWIITRPDLVEYVQQVGYDGVEIWTQSFDNFGFEAVKEAVDALRCELIAVNPYFDFTTSAASMEKSLCDAGKYISYAASLRAQNVRAYLSPFGTFNGVNSRIEDATDDEWDRAVNGAQKVCDLALERGMTVLLEPNEISGQLYDTSETCLRFLNRVRRKNLKVNLQVPLCKEDPLYSAHMLAPYVTHLHAHNLSKPAFSVENIVMLDDDSGVIDFEAYLKLLIGHGFNGCISIEHAFPPDSERIAKHQYEYLNTLLASLHVRNAD